MLRLPCCCHYYPSRALACQPYGFVCRLAVPRFHPTFPWIPVSHRSFRAPPPRSSPAPRHGCTAAGQPVPARPGRLLPAGFPPPAACASRRRCLPCPGLPAPAQDGPRRCPRPVQGRTAKRCKTNRFPPRAARRSGSPPRCTPCRPRRCQSPSGHRPRTQARPASQRPTLRAAGPPPRSRPAPYTAARGRTA